MYIAIQDVGKFKRGDQVPKDLAEKWNSMFVVNPCKFVEDKKPEKTTKKKSSKKRRSRKKKKK